MARQNGTSHSAPAALVGQALLLYVLFAQLSAFLGWGIQQLFPTGAIFHALIACFRALAAFLPAFLFLRHGMKQYCIPFPGKKGRFPIATILPFFLAFSLLLNVASSLLYGVVQQTLGWQVPSGGSLPDTPAARVLAFLGSCVLVPLAEELLFRGAVQTTLRSYGSGSAVLFASLAFTFLHANWWEIPTILLLSLFLGYTAETCRSVWPGVVLHACNNVLAFVAAAAGQALSPAFWGIFLGCILLWGAVAAVYLYRRRLTKMLRPLFFTHWGQMLRTPALVAAMVVIALQFAVYLLG